MPQQSVLYNNNNPNTHNSATLEEMLESNKYRPIPPQEIFYSKYKNALMKAYTPEMRQEIKTAIQEKIQSFKVDNGREPYSNELYPIYREVYLRLMGRATVRKHLLYSDVNAIHDAITKTEEALKKNPALSVTDNPYFIALGKHWAYYTDVINGPVVGKGTTNESSVRMHLGLAKTDVLEDKHYAQFFADKIQKINQNLPIEKRNSRAAFVAEYIKDNIVGYNTDWFFYKVAAPGHRFHDNLAQALGVKPSELNQKNILELVSNAATDEKTRVALYNFIDQRDPADPTKFLLNDDERVAANKELNIEFAVRDLHRYYLLGSKFPIGKDVFKEDVLTRPDYVELKKTLKDVPAYAAYVTELEKTEAKIKAHPDYSFPNTDEYFNSLITIPALDGTKDHEYRLNFVNRFGINFPKNEYQFVGQYLIFSGLIADSAWADPLMQPAVKNELIEKIQAIQKAAGDKEIVTDITNKPQLLGYLLKYKDDTSLRDYVLGVGGAPGKVTLPDWNANISPSNYATVLGYKTPLEVAHILTNNRYPLLRSQVITADNSYENFIKAAEEKIEKQGHTVIGANENPFIIRLAQKMQTAGLIDPSIAENSKLTEALLKILNHPVFKNGIPTDNDVFYENALLFDTNPSWLNFVLRDKNLKRRLAEILSPSKTESKEDFLRSIYIRRKDTKVKDFFDPKKNKDIPTEAAEGFNKFSKKTSAERDEIIEIENETDKIKKAKFQEFKNPLRLAHFYENNVPKATTFDEKGKEYIEAKKDVTDDLEKAKKTNKLAELITLNRALAVFYSTQLDRTTDREQKRYLYDEIKKLDGRYENLISQALGESFPAGGAELKFSLSTLFAPTYYKGYNKLNGDIRGKLTFRKIGDFVGVYEIIPGKDGKEDHLRLIDAFNAGLVGISFGAAMIGNKVDRKAIFQDEIARQQLLDDAIQLDPSDEKGRFTAEASPFIKPLGYYNDALKSSRVPVVSTALNLYVWTFAAIYFAPILAGASLFFMLGALPANIADAISDDPGSAVSGTYNPLMNFIRILWGAKDQKAEADLYRQVVAYDIWKRKAEYIDEVYTLPQWCVEFESNMNASQEVGGVKARQMRAEVQERNKLRFEELWNAEFTFAYDDPNIPKEKIDTYKRQIYRKMTLEDLNTTEEKVLAKYVQTLENRDELNKNVPYDVKKPDAAATSTIIQKTVGTPKGTPTPHV